MQQGMDKAKEHFSTSGKGAGAALLGAIAGGMVAANATKEKKGKKGKRGADVGIGATLAGALVGGLGANALEKKYDE